MQCFVLMGVSGCGKSSVGTALSVLCGVDYVDGDDLHPRDNIAKMSRGEALTDEDRAPWLVQVGSVLAKSEKPIVVGCSALKKEYRDIIRAQVNEPVHFMHLDASKEILTRRMAGRHGHFMPTSLLDSQFEALELLDENEWGCKVDIAYPYAQVIEQAENYVRERMI